MTEQLKPCPFCGGEAQILKDPSIHLDHVLVGCGSDICDIRPARASFIRAEAVEMWNRRADGWISVAERLPEISDHTWRTHIRVLASFTDGSVREMAYDCNVYAKTERGRAPRWEETNGKLAYSQPLYWQPLPAAPKRGGV